MCKNASRHKKLKIKASNENNTIKLVLKGCKTIVENYLIKFYFS